MPAPTHRRPSRTAHRPEVRASGLTVQQARTAGWTNSALRHALLAGDLARPQAGIVDRPIPAGRASEDWERRAAANLRSARASALASPRAILSHQSAAIDWGIPVIKLRPRGCVTVPNGTALRRLAGAHLHRATLLPEHVVQRDEFAVTSVARTVLDVAREHGVEPGVVAADYALHHELADLAELDAMREFCRGWPGYRAARATVALADHRAESPLESLSRLRIRKSGLVAPDLQPWILDEHGTVIGRCDFYWEQYGVVGEADGDLKYAEGAASIVAERDRAKGLEDTGLVIVRWGWRDLDRFDKVARRLEAAFGRGYPPNSPDRRWLVVPT